jgi:hypothetical protein
VNPRSVGGPGAEAVTKGISAHDPDPFLDPYSREAPISAPWPHPTPTLTNRHHSGAG